MNGENQSWKNASPLSTPPPSKSSVSFSVSICYCLYVFFSDQNWWWCASYTILFLGFDSHPNLIKKKLSLFFIRAYLYFHSGFWLFERKIGWMCVFLSDQNCWWWACYAIMFLGSDSHPNLIKQKAIFNLYTCISSFSFSFWFLTIRKKNWVNVCIFMR